MIDAGTAYVASVQASPPAVQIRLDGETAALQSKCRYLASYSPSVGDRVLYIMCGGARVVLGKLK